MRRLEIKFYGKVHVGMNRCQKTSKNGDENLNGSGSFCRLYQIVRKLQFIDM